VLHTAGYQAHLVENSATRQRVSVYVEGEPAYVSLLMLPASVVLPGLTGQNRNALRALFGTFASQLKATESFRKKGSFLMSDLRFSWAEEEFGVKSDITEDTIRAIWRYRWALSS